MIEAALASPGAERRCEPTTCDYYKIGIAQESHFHDSLAKILGYPHDDEYGWVTGDHVADSLLLELEGKFPATTENEPVE